MDSPTDLFDDSTSQMSLFGSASHTDLPGHLQSQGGRPLPASRPPPYPLIQHLLQPGAAPRRPGGQLQPNTAHQQNLGTRRYFDNRVEEDEEEEGEERDGQEGRGVEGEEEGLLEGKRRRSSGVALVAEWSRDVLRVKKMKLEGVVGRRDGEMEGGGRRERGGGGGREGRRREREELKEQLEEAKERLQALQERVWRAFGEKHTEEKRRCRNEDGGEGDGGMIDEDEDIAEGMFDDEEDMEGGDMDSLSVSVFPHPASQNFHSNQKQGDEKRGGDREGRMAREREEGLFLEGLIERAGVWLGCGGLVRGAWDGGMEGGEEEGGQKFAQALKLELGSAVARVIDRVLRLYTDTADLLPPPPSSVSILPSESVNGGGRGGGVWMGLMGDGGEERERDERGGGQDCEREKRLPTQTNGSVPPTNQSRHREHPADAMPLVIRRLHDKPRANPLLGPPFPSYLPPSHPGLSLRHPPPPHPSLRPPPSRPKDSSSFLPSSFPPPPPPPLPLPLLHYSMQQLFSRSLSHLPRLPPSHKDYLNSDPFLEFPSHPFPPHPLLGHLDPSLAPHHADRERDGGMRGGGGGMDGGEMYLQPGGSHVYSQEGLSPCHLKKAKLMFFYTRYPSSNTLKTYFPDVKFNRCVTSQLIKWFSNFREFFYIQMERFARQAVREAFTGDGAPRLGRESQLHMGRDTELYRILNMHYNKSNVYQVPERFIEVAEVTLREFYSAIQTGRDSDPCWKKGIYKIVCKLDSSVPDSFRLPGCPVG